MSVRTDYDEIAALLRRARAAQWTYAAVRERFEAEVAPTYGEGMAMWVPEYAYAHNLLLDALGMYLPEGGRVLDLGAGTGRFSQMVLERYDQCHVTLVDFSANMLQEASRKLSLFSERYDMRPGDFFEDAIDFPGQSFDCVASVFAICHGREADRYRRLYQKIYHWLKPGGCFLCYDHVLGDAEPFTVLNVVGWRSFIQASQTPESVQEGIVGTYQEDTPLSLRQHLDLLWQAGFAAADVLWKRDIFAIYAGVKTALRIEQSHDA
jgi:tRNA (cmo5U34)-methyltransferase